MTLLSLGLAAVMSVAGQTAAVGVPCGDPAFTLPMRQLCLGDEDSTRALSLPPQSGERRKTLEAAADHYRRAADTATGDLKVRALTGLAETYGASRLNDAPQREIVLRELIALVPAEPRYAFDLAALQEAEDFPDAAEDTLLSVRQRHPQDPEVFRRLAQFYSRRIGALDRGRSNQVGSEPVASGERDADGVYRIGGQVQAPPRAGTPRYPAAAQDASIQGAVETEIVIDEQGQVRDARVVKSVPLLDESALEAVQKWRFEPTVVDGRAVPVRMVVTVRFTLSK